jgi:diketogulonate reductase-like aldo/keto reductase
MGVFMEYVTAQSRKIPALGFGTWKLAGLQAVKAVDMALGTGYRHIDTAQIYENENEVGEAIKNSGVARGDIFLTTKVWLDRVGQDLQKSVDESLRRLKTDYVDLLLIHWPNTDVPFTEQMAGLAAVQKAGKTKLIGVSNFTVAQMKDVVEKIGAPIVTNQVEYHPFLNQKPVLDYLRAHDMFLTAYCPLARGNASTDTTINELAAKYGKTPGQVILRWHIQQSNVCAIPKAGSEKHIKDNFMIFDFKLEDADMKKINQLANPSGRLVNPAWAPAWDIAA